MLVWIVRLYKSRGEVVGGGTLFWRIASVSKPIARGKKKGLGIWPSSLEKIIIWLITPLRLFLYC